MNDSVTKRDLRNELDNYVSKQKLKDDLRQLPYLRESTIREVVQNAIRSQWVKDQNAQAKNRLIAGKRLGNYIYPVHGGAAMMCPSSISTPRVHHESERNQKTSQSAAQV